MDNRGFEMESTRSQATTTSNVSTIEIGEGGQVLSINDAHTKGYVQPGVEVKPPSTPPTYEESLQNGQTLDNMVAPRPVDANDVSPAPPPRPQSAGRASSAGNRSQSSVKVLPANGMTSSNAELMEQEKLDYERLEQERRDREPLLFCKLITEHPKKAFGLYSYRAHPMYMHMAPRS